MYKALIIDDERPVQIAVQKLGLWDQYHIEPPKTASNGQEALLLMRQTRPDLCFVDMEMPIMNGTEFLSKASAEFPGTQFIIISGYDDFKYAHCAIQAGACDYLLKPIVQNDLNAAIRRAIGRIQPQADVPDEEAADSVSPEKVVEIIKDYIDRNYRRNIRLSMFTEQYFFSKEYLSKLFKSRYGCGIYTYVQEVRMKRAKDMLLDPSVKISDIAKRLGYADNNYFSKAFKNYYGYSPSQFRKEHEKAAAFPSSEFSACEQETDML